MQAQIWDGARRDLMPWMGDMHVEALTAYHAFGAGKAVRDSLRAVRELGPDPVPPLTESPMAGLRNVWKGDDLNGISSYTAWWAVALHDYWRYTGDMAFVKEMAPGLPAILRRVAGRVDADGRWTPPSKDWGANFIDWSNLTYDEEQATMQVLGILALDRGADLLDRAGMAKEAGEFRPPAGKMKTYLRDRLVDSGRGVIVSPRHHANALAIDGGLFDAQLSRSLFHGAVAKPMDVFFTPWWRYYDLAAASAVGETQWGLDEIRSTWGGMLDAGATTFWESFDRSYLKAKDPHAVTLTTETIQGYGGYRTSLCHGWSSGPAVWLHTSVLGVTPLADGFARFRFAPALGDLAWAEGVIPTPKGAIKVRVERKGAGVAGRVELPEGVEGETLIPGLELKGPGVRIFERS